MLTWDELVSICEVQMPKVHPAVFERALIDLAEPDFARVTECIDAEKAYTTVADTGDYELPLGVVRIQRVEFKGRKLEAVKIENLLSREQYWSDGTTLRTGTPLKYYTTNDRLHLIPVPTEAAGLRVWYAALPTYAIRKYIALTGTDPTTVYLEIGIPELATDTVTFTNVTRGLTGNCSAYTLDGSRHKYTVASMAAQAVGDVISLVLYKYIPMIPEIHVQRLIPYAISMGYASQGKHGRARVEMQEYERKRDEVIGERNLRGYPTEVVHRNPVIR